MEREGREKGERGKREDRRGERGEREERKGGGESGQGKGGNKHEDGRVRCVREDSCGEQTQITRRNGRVRRVSRENERNT